MGESANLLQHEPQRKCALSRTVETRHLRARAAHPPESRGPRSRCPQRGFPAERWGRTEAAGPHRTSRHVPAFLCQACHLASFHLNYLLDLSLAWSMLGCPGVRACLSRSGGVSRDACPALPPRRGRRSRERHPRVWRCVRASRERAETDCVRQSGYGFHGGMCRGQRPGAAGAECGN